MGALIAIPHWCLAIGPIGNRQSKIGNVGQLGFFIS
jgi:hypothetical protein